jgi:4-hydroxy-tetrahydrodipicolinate synthase
MSERNITRLCGSVAALATPFRDAGLDEGAVVAMVDRQIRCGTAGLIVCGSTGEAAMLSLSDHARLIRLVVAVAAGRIPVIAGCTASATDMACALAVAAARSGADGLLLAAPPYVRPTQAGIVNHVHAVGRAADLPIILYDVPGRVGVAIADETVAALHAASQIVAIKDATGDLTRPVRLHDLCGSGLAQFSGEDAQALRHRGRGGVGCMSVTANVAPALCTRLHRLLDAGQTDTAQRIDALLAPLHAALFAESNPIPLKAALSMLGLCRETVRAPLTPASRDTRVALEQAIAGVMQAEEAAEADRVGAMTQHSVQLRLVG